MNIITVYKFLYLYCVIKLKKLVHLKIKIQTFCVLFKYKKQREYNNETLYA